MENKNNIPVDGSDSSDGGFNDADISMDTEENSLPQETKLDIESLAFKVESIRL